MKPNVKCCHMQHAFNVRWKDTFLQHSHGIIHSKIISCFKFNKCKFKLTTMVKLPETFLVS